MSREIISCIIGDNYISCIIEESGLVGLRHYNWSWTVTGSNPIRCTRSAGLRDSVLLQGFQWPFGQNCTNAVIKVGWVKSPLLCLLFCLQFGCFIYFYCAFCLASVFAPCKKGHKVSNYHAVLLFPHSNVLFLCKVSRWKASSKRKS